ncbi:receptor protein-tyrosine kinase [Nitrosomonas sp. Nm51]|uniref:polysaccharide biosynthesis tyrosine autokinase n=1 Tax=Nitrosomonas sp. Nm51 TaxID=133720 RepID=UPI0008CA7637|nr:polysaccharide biosynthesis tyrosine autokinase [Nitrosomonas sp. Nm51]SER64929.1 receptor protein-tyrosine kinase [Nitrosomonas sp. Nm51]
MSISIPPAIQFVKTQNTVSLTDSIQRHTLRIGQILLEMGKITREDTERILQLQKKNQIRFGEAAKQLGLVSDIDVQHAMTYQFGSSHQLPKQAGTTPELPVIDQPGGTLAESIRSVRTQLMLRGFPSKQNVLAVVGVRQDCGTSRFAANLAALYSQLDKRTLLIDANFRNPVQHQIFGLTDKHGLSDMLAGHTVITDVMVTIESLPNLTILPAGTLPPHSSELLGMSTFNSTHELLAGQFDVVLYDTPGYMESTDALLIANNCDYVLLAVHKNQSRLDDVIAVSKQMADNGTTIIGTVLVDY